MIGIRRTRISARRKQARLRRPQLEILEERMVLATVSVGDLMLSGEFEDDVATGQVLIGFDETNPLIAINDGQVTADPDDGTFAIMPSGEGMTVSITIFTLDFNPAIWMTDSQNPVTFDADVLISGGHDFDPDGDDSVGITVAGIDDAFFTTNLALAEGENDAADLVNLQGFFDFGAIGLSGLQVGVTDDNKVEIDSQTKDITLTGVDAKIEKMFTAAGVELDGSLDVGYSEPNEFTFGGGVTVKANGLEGEEEGSSLGATLDMTVKAGEIEAIELSISGSFNVYALEIEPDELTFEYSTSDEQFVIYGDVTAKVPNGEANDDNSDSTSLTARLGTSDDPGLIIDTSGTVSQVNVSVFGTLNVFGFVLESPQSNPATFQYKAEGDLYELSGTISAPKFWNATITMGPQAQPGIMIHEGKWSVDNLEISISDVNLGAFTINDFDVKYVSSGSDIDLDFRLDVTFPRGWEVEAQIDTIFNTKTKAFEINDVFLKASGLQIAIGDTGLFLTEIDASIQNIFQPSNLIVSGDITVEFGEDVKIFGETARFFLAQGGFTVDKDMLEIDAEVWVGAFTSGGKTSGLLGTGTGKVVLDWADQNYSMDVKASLYDGVFTFEEKFEFSAGDPLEVLISAKAQVNVPHGIPLIGGKELGELDFLFKYEAPAEKGGQAEGFVAAWTRVDLVFTHVEAGIEYDFVENKVKTIGSGTIHALQKEASAPQTKTYVYTQPFTNATGATQATLSVNWNRTFSSTPTSVKVSVELPDGTTVIEQDHFSASNGLKLITTSSGGNDLSSSTQTNVGVVNSAAMTKTLAGTVTSGSDLVSLSGSTDGLNGWAVSGTGIPAGTTVVVIDENTLKLNQAATSSAASTSLSFTDPFLALPLVSNQDFTKYLLKVTFTSESAPIHPSVAIASITAGAGNMAQVTFTGGVPSTLRVGDTIDISGSNVSTYNTSGMFMVTEITSNGVVINQPFHSDATGGTMRGWTLPQFSATYHIPPPTIRVSEVEPEVSTSRLTVTMPVHVSSALASGTTVEVYIDDFEENLGANQDFNGLLLASGVPLGPALEGGSQDQYNATATVNLAQSNLGLLPIEYYLYAVVSDGTNTPVTSTLTDDGMGGFLEAFDNDFALSGSITNQLMQDLNGWTVFVDVNGNGQLDPGDPSYTTTNDGFYGFYSDQLPNGEFDVVLQQLDPTGFTFDAPSLGIPATGYTIVNGGNGLSTTASWDGSTPVTADFELAQLSSIAGIVKLSEGEGLGGWTVFLDANANAQLDPGEISTLTKADGTYRFTNFNAAAITSISSSSSLSAPTTVLNLAGAVPSALKVGDTIAVSGSSVAGYNTMHTITAVNAQNVVTDVAFTTDATGGLLTGPGVTETVALAILNGSAATYAFAPGQVQGTLVHDASGGANALKHVGTLENGAAAGKADSFSIEDHANAGTDNQILNLPTGATVDVPNTSDLEPGTGDFSAAGWLRASDISQSGALAGLLESGSTNGGWEFGITQGSLEFAGQFPVEVHTKPEFIAVADFNVDGKPDLAVANEGSNSIWILVNTTQPGAGAPTFVLGNNFVVGANPTFIAVADFNGDGKPDLAIADSGTDTISVTLNRVTPGSTTATFSTPRSFTVGNGPKFIAVADINRDGKPDVTVANAGANSVSVLLNETGLGSMTPGFSSQLELVIANGPSFIAVDDYNGDGNPDLAVANADSNNVSILLNKTGAGAGSPSFEEKHQLDVGSTPTFLAVADINRDGKPDLAVANSAGTEVSVLLNRTSPGSTTASFAAEHQLAVGSKPNFIAIGDFNTDGIADLAVSNSESNNVSVLLNKTAAGGTAASFDDGVQFAVGTTPNFISVEDLDSDGKPDLVVANSGGTHLSMLRNETGSGASTPQFASDHMLAVGDAPTYIATSDFNGDGKLDLASANSGSGNISILFNSSLLVGREASFAGNQTFGIGTTAEGVPFQADFNVDGRPDFALPYVNSVTGIAVLLNGTAAGASTASFAGERFAFGSSTFGPIGLAADFNGDGKPDLAAALQDMGHVEVRINTTEPGAATPRFGTAEQFGVHHPVTYAVTADVNGDGRPDIIVAAPSGTDAGFTILLNTTTPGSTTPSFTGHTINSGVPKPNLIVPEDFNGDGRPDLAFGDVNTSHVSVLINRTSPGSGSPSFASARTFGVHAEVLDIVTPDLNGDGKPDLAVGNLDGNLVSILLNTTSPGSDTASFANHVNFGIGGIPEDLEAADVNGDGRPDLMSANFNGAFSVLLNETAPGAAAPAFAPLFNQSLGSELELDHIMAEDVNGDGRPDLVVGNIMNTTVSVLLNQTILGARSIDLAKPISVGGGNPSGATFLSITDVNGDGKPDLAVGAGFGSATNNQLSVVLNTYATDAIGPYIELVENSGSGSGSLKFVDPLTAIDADTWYHLAFTYDAGAEANEALKLYVNGALAATSANRGTLPAGADVSSPSGVDLLIGDLFDGYLDDVSVWGSVLTAAQIKALYNGTTSPSYTQTSPTDPSTYQVTLSGAFDLAQANNFTITASNTVSIEDVPDPRLDSVDEITITFSQPVLGFDVADLTLRRNGGENLLVGSVTLTSDDGVTWILGNLGEATGLPGQYVLVFDADLADVTNLDGVTRPQSAVELWVNVVQPGDANRDGAFDDLDVLAVSEAGAYRTGESAAWERGDFNGDGVFDEFDVIASLQTGLFDQGPYFTPTAEAVGQRGATAASAKFDPAAVDTLFAESPAFTLPSGRFIQSSGLPLTMRDSRSPGRTASGVQGPGRGRLNIGIATENELAAALVSGTNGNGLTRDSVR